MLRLLLVLLMKKTALKLTIIFALLFLVVGVQLVSLVKGNFYPFYPPPPDADPPNIAILSPKNNTAYSSGELNITVCVTRSEIPSGYTLESWSVSLLLDGVLIDSVSEYIPRSEVDINTVLHDPFNGKHVLEVEASYRLKSLVSFTSIKSTSTVSFSVENITKPSPSPSPVATLTPEPTATPEPESSPTSLVVASSVTVAVVCIGLGLLVYLIKRK